MEKPKNVAIAVNLLWIGILGGSASSLVRAVSTPTQYLPFIVIVLLCSVAFMAFLNLKISAGRNWARITFAVIFAIGVLPWLAMLVFRFSELPTVSLVISAVNFILQSCALYLLFTNPGSSWFRKAASSMTKPQG
ncbi:MAG: hypothetical protein C5B53_03945 [Candidatus Melainabacteria bacterium]|nr:MAG: hypothetical protein C5B53_03945 [Candidatus Melainabacteria bacterium]